MISFKDGSFWYDNTHRVYGCHRLLATAYGYHLEDVKRSQKARSGGRGTKGGCALDTALEKWQKRLEDYKNSKKKKKAPVPRGAGLRALLQVLEKRRWTPLEIQKPLGRRWMGTAADLVCRNEAFGTTIVVSLKTGYFTKENPTSDRSFVLHKKGFPSALDRAIAQVDCERALLGEGGACVLLVNPKRVVAYDLKTTDPTRLSLLEKASDHLRTGIPFAPEKMPVIPFTKTEYEIKD